jgi:hypothetical protein
LHTTIYANIFFERYYFDGADYLLVYQPKEDHTVSFIEGEFFNPRCRYSHKFWRPVVRPKLSAFRGLPPVQDWKQHSRKKKDAR